MFGFGAAVVGLTTLVSSAFWLDILRSATGEVRLTLLAGEPVLLVGNISCSPPQLLWQATGQHSRRLWRCLGKPLIWTLQGIAMHSKNATVGINWTVKLNSGIDVTEICDNLRMPTLRIL